MKISLMLFKKCLDAKPGPLFQWPNLIPNPKPIPNPKNAIWAKLTKTKFGGHLILLVQSHCLIFQNWCNLSQSVLKN